MSEPIGRAGRAVGVRACEPVGELPRVLHPQPSPFGTSGRCEERYPKEPHSDTMRSQPTPKYRPAATSEAAKATSVMTTFRMRTVWRTPRRCVCWRDTRVK